MEMVLPMNTGAEAVETAIMAARRWGYRTKGIADGRAHIIAFENNFHGRTTTIVGFSSEPAYREQFGPFGRQWQGLVAHLSQQGCDIDPEPVRDRIDAARAQRRQPVQHQPLLQEVHLPGRPPGERTVAALQQIALVLWLVPLNPWGEIPEAAPLFHFSRSLVFLAAGLVALCARAPDRSDPGP
jgi:hypothetical protein